MSDTALDRVRKRAQLSWKRTKRKSTRGQRRSYSEILIVQQKPVGTIFQKERRRDQFICQLCLSRARWVWLYSCIWNNSVNAVTVRSLIQLSMYHCHWSGSNNSVSFVSIVLSFHLLSADLVVCLSKHERRKVSSSKDIRCTSKIQRQICKCKRGGRRIKCWMSAGDLCQTADYQLWW